MAKNYRKPSSRRHSKRRIERRRRAVAGAWVGTDAGLLHLIAGSVARVVVRHCDHEDRRYDGLLATMIADVLFTPRLSRGP